MQNNYTEQQLKAIEEQDQALDELLALIKKGETSLKVAGVAGTGKTQLVIKLLQRLSCLYGKQEFACAAVSHNAKNIVAIRAGSSGVKVKAYTLASLLGMNQLISDEGVITFVPKKKEFSHFDKVAIGYQDVIIIDECSQVSTTLMEKINSLRKPGSIVIYLGDWHQNRPIDSKEDSPTFKLPGVSLVIPFRYEGDIQLLSEAIAEKIDDSKVINLKQGLDFLIPFIKESNKDYTFMRDKNEFKNKYLNELKQGDIGHCMLTTYRKDSMTEYNAELRALYTGGRRERFYVGEIILCKRGNKLNMIRELVTSKLYRINNITEGNVYVNYSIDEEDSTEIIYEIVYNIGSPNINLNEDFDNSFSIPIYRLQLEDEEGLTYDDVIVLKDNKNLNYVSFKDKLEQIAIKLKTKAKWVDYYEFIHYFEEFDYAYAGNIHVIQGATYDVSYVDLRDIATVKPISTREKLQAFYTAVTRAREKVVILY